MPAQKQKTDTLVQRAVNCRQRAAEYDRRSRHEENAANAIVARMNAEQLREYLRLTRGVDANILTGSALTVKDGKLELLQKK